MYAYMTSNVRNYNELQVFLKIVMIKNDGDRDN